MRNECSAGLPAANKRRETRSSTQASPTETNTTEATKKKKTTESRECQNVCRKAFETHPLASRDQDPTEQQFKSAHGLHLRIAAYPLNREVSTHALLCFLTICGTSASYQQRPSEKPRIAAHGLTLWTTNDIRKQHVRPLAGVGPLLSVCESVRCQGRTRPPCAGLPVRDRAKSRTHRTAGI